MKEISLLCPKPSPHSHPPSTTHFHLLTRLCEHAEWTTNTRDSGRNRGDPGSLFPFSSALFLTLFPSKSLDREPWVFFAFMASVLFSLSLIFLYMFSLFYPAPSSELLACSHHSLAVDSVQPVGRRGRVWRHNLFSALGSCGCMYVCMPWFHPSAPLRVYCWCKKAKECRCTFQPKWNNCCLFVSPLLTQKALMLILIPKKYEIEI